MKAKVKELYESIKHLKQLTAEIGVYYYDLDNPSEWWDEAAQAAENVEEAIDILQELYDEY